MEKWTKKLLEKMMEKITGKIRVKAYVIINRNGRVTQQ